MRHTSSGWIIRILPVFLFSLVFSLGTTLANVPAAYFACEGASHGDHCQLPGPRYGNCVLDTLCEDPSETAVNECLLCVDGCWGLVENQACIMRDGSDGVCQGQNDCTTDPEKSFDQCNWCVEGDIPRNQPKDGGCTSTDAYILWPWAICALLAARQCRRDRA